MIGRRDPGGPRARPYKKTDGHDIIVDAIAGPGASPGISKIRGYWKSCYKAGGMKRALDGALADGAAKTVAEATYRRLRDDLTALRFPPGERLRFRTLAET